MYITLKHFIGKQVEIKTTNNNDSISGTITKVYQDDKEWVVKLQKHHDLYAPSKPSGKFMTYYIPGNFITSVKELLDPYEFEVVELDNQGNPLPFTPIKTYVEPELPKVEQPKPKEPTLPIPLSVDGYALSGYTSYPSVIDYTGSNDHSNIYTGY